MSFIFQLTHTAGSVCQLKNIQQPNQLSPVVMLLDKWNLGLGPFDGRVDDGHYSVAFVEIKIFAGQEMHVYSEQNHLTGSNNNNNTNSFMDVSENKSEQNL